MELNPLIARAVTAIAIMQPHIYESAIPTPFIPHISVFDYLFPPAPGISPAEDHDASTPAFIDGLSGAVLRRGDIKNAALALVTGLRALGVRRGDTACIWGFNSFAWVIAAYGCMAAGLVVSPANASYAPHEIAHQVNDSGSQVIFVSPENLGAFREATREIKYAFDDTRIVLLCTPDAKPAGAERLKCVYDLLEMGPPAREAEHFEGLESEQTAWLCYSSGTTGLPKGVMTMHRNLTAQLSTTPYLYPPVKKGEDVISGWLPLSHVYGLAAILLMPVKLGVPVVLLPRFEEAAALNAIEKYKISLVLMVPPVLLLFVQSQNVPKYDLSSMRYATCGAAPLGPDLAGNFKRRFPYCTLLQSYGMTETSPGCILALPEDTRAGHLGVGRLVPSYQARLVREDGTDAPPGERGELWVRGPNIMKGYHRNPEATAKTMEPGGWLKTGDVLICDDNGRWSVVDRVKELIKYKGFQVAPAELEGLLLQHPKVADAGVIGVYDDSQATELPRAYIVAAPSAGVKSPADGDALAREVQAWVAARVSGHKRLIGGVVVTDAIPKSPSGKILRNLLRERAKKEFVSAAQPRL